MRFCTERRGDPLPGDVNEDGVVDVGDIVAVTDIIQSNNESAPVTYKYYLGVMSESNLQNQQYVNDLIANSPTTTTNAPITSITLPSGAPSNNGYEHIFIYPESWGTPTLIDHNTSDVLGLNTLPDANISNPTGYAGFFLYDPMSNAGGVIDITWNNAPIPGDVNNDGNVDGDDITAIIDIIQSNNENAPVTYKYYLDETEQETFTESDLVLTATEPITSITAHQSVGEYEVTLWIYPTSWGRPSSIKSVGTQAEMLQSWTFNDDWAIVPYGYTSAWIAVDGTETWTVTWPYYKYYLGVISEDDIMNQAAVNALINNSSTTTNAPITSITLPSGAPTNNGYEHIFIYPSDWGTPSLIDHKTSQVLPLKTLDYETGISNPTGYAGFYLFDPMSNAGGVIDITWSNN